VLFSQSVIKDTIAITPHAITFDSTGGFLNPFRMSLSGSQNAFIITVSKVTLKFGDTVTITAKYNQGNCADENGNPLPKMDCMPDYWPLGVSLVSEYCVSGTFISSTYGSGEWLDISYGEIKHGGIQFIYNGIATMNNASAKF